ncbi:MAG: antibiotic biosynthesis monooxygenase family protein [Asticcacaulis sp.]
MTASSETPDSVVVPQSAPVADPRDGVTLINLYTVTPDLQATLAEALSALMDEAVRIQPGFRSSRILRSLDGQTVASYAEWDSEADWKAMFRDAEVNRHMEQVLKLANFQTKLYALCSSHTKAEPED